MSAVNSVRLTGKVGAKIWRRASRDGEALLVRFTLGTRSRYQNTPVDWHFIVARARLAESCLYLTKGSLISIEGYLANKTWRSKYGALRKRNTVIADDIVIHHIAKAVSPDIVSVRADDPELASFAAMMKAPDNARGYAIVANNAESYGGADDPGMDEPEAEIEGANDTEADVRWED